MVCTTRAKSKDQIKKSQIKKSQIKTSQTSENTKSVNKRQSMEELPKMEKAKQKTRRREEMEQVWFESCKKDENTLLCQAGKGNQLANFILRMKFVVPKNHNLHTLRGLYDLINKVPLLGKAITNIPLLKKIEKNEEISWADLNFLVNAIQAIPGASKGVSSVSSRYGVSLDDSDDNYSTGSSQSSVDLEYLWKKNCEVQDGIWKGTLFCELPYDDASVARWIGNLKFVAPLNDPNNHVVLKLLNIIITALKKPDPKTDKQSWTNWGIQKALEYSFSDLKNKIENNEPITWEDLDKLYSMSNFSFSKIPILGSKIESALEGKDLHQIIENTTNDALNKRGIGFAPRNSF